MNPNIIAKTGWRTDDLWNGMIDEVKSSRKYNIVSLMIGVNNQYQHKSMISFEAELEALIDKASAKCAYGEEGVFLMSIPDYGVTPFAGEKSEGVSKELRDWNAAILKVSKKKNVQHFDITPLSRKAVNDTSLLAPDRLHPSGKMYKEWVEQIAESVYIRLKANIKVFPNE
jgi:acyl-CoA thioesterase-1